MRFRVDLASPSRAEGSFGATDGSTGVALRSSPLLKPKAAGLLPLCHWGCAIYSFVHCPSGLVYGWDPNRVEPDDDVPFFVQEYLLETWIEAWLDGSLRQPWLINDPGTGTYRGATIAETRSALEPGS